jgi:hypothetical protein
MACKDGNLEVVQAAVNNTPRDQRAALLRADDTDGWVSLCLILKRTILSTECLQPYGTGLHKAAGKGHTAIVSYIIEVGAALNAQNGVGRGNVNFTLLTQTPGLWGLLILQHRSQSDAIAVA